MRISQRAPANPEHHRPVPGDQSLESILMGSLSESEDYSFVRHCIEKGLEESIAYAFSTEK